MSQRELAALALADLVDVAAGGGPEAQQAWGLLVERHAALVWKKVRHFGLPQEAASEAYQSTWLRAIERLDTLRDTAYFPGWLGTIAQREALGVIRARGRAVPLGSLPDRMADDPPVGDRHQRGELVDAVRAGFARLPEDCQSLLRLLTADPPVSYLEIERLLHMRRGSIGPTRKRCLEKLRNSPSVVAFTGPGT